MSKGGLSFLHKKSWHTGTLRVRFSFDSNWKHFLIVCIILLQNAERVWKAEEKAKDEAKKVAQLQKELQEERQLQELRQMQRESGLIRYVSGS